MKNIFLLTVLFSCVDCFGQKKFDNKIIIKPDDTTNLVKAVKIALVNTGFIVKDNYSDTLQTYALETKIGYVIARAEVVNGTVTLSGVYGLRRVDDWGYTRTPENYTRIIYYSGSKTWRTLMDVAEKIKGQISYSK